jgi:hypothetical protein
MMMGFMALLPAAVSAAEDPGQARIAMLRVTVYHATNGDPKSAGPKTLPVAKETAERIASEERLSFKHYRLLGEDMQPLLRSYESWGEPLKPSDEVLVRFEAQGHVTDGGAMLDIELWLARKKVLKAAAQIERNKPIYMLGPEWRGGHLIITVTLVPLENTNK